MTYTVWFGGLQIGGTAFELRRGSRRRVGVFHPTEFGLSVLPGITAMATALIDTGRECRARRIDPDEEDPDPAILESVLATPPGRRMMEAARHIARLELRGPTGDLIIWESILISDLLELRELARTPGDDARETTDEAETFLASEIEPVRYLISATFEKRPRAAPRRSAMTM